MIKKNKRFKIKIMQYLLYAVLTIFSLKTEAQPISYEQNAIEYFMNSVFDLKYKKIKVIEFNCFTENTITRIRYGNNCFNNITDLHRNLIINAQDKVVPEKKIEFPSRNSLKIKQINAQSSKRFKLRITGANVVNNRYYVSIEMLKLKSHVDTYLFEMDENRKVLRWCETGAVF